MAYQVCAVQEDGMLSRALWILVVLSLLAAPALPATGDGGQGTPSLDSKDLQSVLLHLKAGAFDPVLDGPPGPSVLQARSTGPYHVVQFDGPIQRSWREALAGLGVATLEYIPDHAYFAHVPEGRVDDVERLPHVRYVGPAHPAYRLHPVLWGEVGGGPARELALSTWDAQGATSVAARLADLGAAVLAHDDHKVVAVARVAAAVSALADPMLGVSWVEPRWAPEPVNDNDARTARARQATDGEYDTTGQALWSYNPDTEAFEGYTGRNVTVAVADTGLDETHPAFEGRIVRYFDYGNDGMSDVNGHGTHVAGTVLGDGSWRTGDVGVEAKYSGLAPEAGLVVQEVFNNPNPPSIYGRDANNEGVTVSSNSWVAGIWGDYNGYCADYDSMTRDANTFKIGDQPILYVFGAGNDGPGENTIMPPSLAKNVISVGSVGNDKWGNPSTQISGFSSRGPTDDGRIKPDVLMPGDVVASARSADATGGVSKPLDGGNSYAFGSGTSMATPGAAGAAAVVRDYLADVHATDPSPALVKALLINGADVLADYDYPGFEQGWGRVNLDKSLIQRADYLIHWVDQDVRLDTAPGSDEVLYWYMVQRGRPFKVTLVWTDVAGAPSATKNLVNDLDLTLIDPEGNIFSGNDFYGKQSRINNSGNPDRKNNVEGFLLEAPTQGLWQIRIRAHDVPQGAQDFALVVSGEVRKGHIDLAAHRLEATPLGAEEFSNVQLSATVSNVGNRDAPATAWALERVDPDLNTEILLTGSLGAMVATEARELTFNVTGVRGYHTFRLRLDSARAVVESNETNNVAEVVYFFKGHDVTLAAERTNIRTNPGRIVNFSLVATNRGNVDDVMRMYVSEPPPGWQVELTAQVVPLEPDEAFGFQVQVLVPADAVAGEVARINASTVSDGNSSKRKEVELAVTVNQVYGLEVAATTPSVEVRPGEEVELDLLVRNTGNGPDVLTIRTTGPGGEWSVGLEATSLVLALRSEGHVAVMLTAPDPAVAGTSGTVLVTVSSSLAGLSRTANFNALMVQFYQSEVDFVLFVGEGDAGDRVVIPIIVRNRGNGQVEYNGDINLPAESWEGGLDIERMSLGPYTSSRANLTFTIPQDAINASYDFAMVVLSSGGETFYTNFTFTVRQWHSLNLRVGGTGGTGDVPPVTQGQPLQLRVRVDNYGNGDESVQLSLAGAPSDWAWTFEEGVAEVAPFSTVYVGLSVTTSRSTEAGTYELRTVCRYGGTPPLEAMTKVQVEILTRPDLTVVTEGLNLTATRVTVGDSVRLVVIVRNAGQTEARDVYVQLLVDGVSVGQPQWVASLGPGEEESFSFLWTSNRTGTVPLTASVDGLGTVDEYDEGNNEATVYVDVRAVEDHEVLWSVIIIGIVVIAALVAAAGVHRGRHRGGPEL